MFGIIDILLYRSGATRRTVLQSRCCRCLFYAVPNLYGLIGGKLRLAARIARIWMIDFQHLCKLSQFIQVRRAKKSLLFAVGNQSAYSLDIKWACGLCYIFKLMQFKSWSLNTPQVPKPLSAGCSAVKSAQCLGSEPVRYELSLSELQRPAKASKRQSNPCSSHNQGILFGCFSKRINA